MTAAALALVLTASVCHAVWNLAAKRAGGGLPFVAATGLVINVLYLPVVLLYILWRPPDLSTSAIGIVVGSAALKAAYSLSLQRAYRSGDFSVVYPLARGTGPLLTMLIAVSLLGERPHPLGIVGGLLVIAGIFFLTGGPALWRSDRAHLRTGIGYGLLTGFFISAYTLWDRQGVADGAIPPVLFDAGTAYAMTILLAPFAWKRRAEVVQEWRIHRREILIMAILSPLGYILILTALTFTPVSYVAPAREASILIGSFLGAKYLNEANGPRRLGAAAAIVAGIVLLALS
jgi:drug/metabolite transporter (DMT)-like permease